MHMLVVRGVRSAQVGISMLSLFVGMKKSD